MPISPSRNAVGLVLALIAAAVPDVATAAGVFKMPAITYSATPPTAVTRAFTMPEIGFAPGAEHVFKMPPIDFAPAAARVFPMPEIGFAPTAEHTLKMPAIEFVPTIAHVVDTPVNVVAPPVERVFTMPQIRFAGAASEDTPRATFPKLKKP